MANSTFSGVIRSESGLKVVSKNATTGVQTEQMNFDSSGRLLTTAGSHIKYTEAAGYAATDFMVGKGGSSEATADPFTSGAAQLFPLGSQLLYGNTTYRYGKMGSGAVTAGKCVTHAASIAHHFDLTPTAGVAAGETAIC